MKQFKARIEPKVTLGYDPPTIHAMEIWFRARSIFAAVDVLESILSSLGLDGDDVTKLIEVEENQR